QTCALPICEHLDRVVLPFIDDVGADAVVLDPQVPATIIVLIVHAGDDGAELGPLREVDPGTVGERLVLLEIASLWHLKRPARLTLVSFGGDVAVRPGDPGFLFGGALLAVQGK